MMMMTQIKKNYLRDATSMLRNLLQISEYGHMNHGRRRMYCSGWNLITDHGYVSTMILRSSPGLHCRVFSVH